VGVDVTVSVEVGVGDGVGESVGVAVGVDVRVEVAVDSGAVADGVLRLTLAAVTISARLESGCLIHRCQAIAAMTSPMATVGVSRRIGRFLGFCNRARREFSR